MLTTRLFRTIIVGALIVVLVYYATMLVMPIVFSALCAMFIHPWVKRMERLGIGLRLASLISVVIIGSILTAGFALIIYQGVNIVSDLPKDNVEEFQDDPLQKIDEEIHVNLKSYDSEIDAFIASTKTKMIESAPETILNINNVILFLITCPIYIFFMLVCRAQIRSFYYSSFKPGNRKIANRILSQIERVYISYLSGLLYVSLIIAVLTGLGLFILGIEYAIFIGILSGILTIVPYIGVIISALIPIIIAFLTKDSMWYTVGVIGVYIVVQFIEGNIITPKIMGNQVGVNPLMVILGIVIFGAIGGIMGMLLTVPILALLKTIAVYIPGWKPIEELLKVR